MQKTSLSTVITHIGSWLLFLSLPVIFITSQSDHTSTADVLASPDYWLCFIFFITLFYLHTYYLFPILYRGQKKLPYVLSVAVLFLLLLWLKPFDKLMSNWRRQALQPDVTADSLHRQQPLPGDRFSHQNPPPPRNSDDNKQLPPPPDGNRFGEPPMQLDQPSQPINKVDIVSIFMFIIIIAISISLDVSERLHIAAEQAAKAEADKANAELSVLKAQVNPHFLFNTLNNIYSLAVTGDENTAESILKLSNIMRYVTDDAPEDYVPLQKEIDCITDFIDLQRLRIGSKVILTYDVSGNATGRRIAPFILLTFVENIFKYGISNHQVSNIAIRLSVTEDEIGFFCSNPISETRETGRKGTGIMNVKKRLSYLYPGKHSLNISASNNLYTVQLLVKDDTLSYAADLYSH